MKKIGLISILVVLTIALMGCFVTTNGANPENVGTQSPTSQPTEAPSPTTPSVGTRQNPVPINTEVTAEVDDLLDKYSVTIKITEVKRGADAWTAIEAANMFNDEAADGYEYALIKVSLTVNSVEDDKAVDISSYNFDSFTSNNEELERASVVEPEPELGGKLYAGGKSEGYIVVLVKKDDAAPKIVFELGYDGSGGVWMALQ